MRKLFISLILLIPLYLFAQYEPLMSNRLGYNEYVVNYDCDSRIPRFIYYKLTNCTYIPLVRGKLVDLDKSKLIATIESQDFDRF